MQEKLKWNAIDLVKKTQIFLNYVQKEKIPIPVDHSSKHDKLQGFIK